MSNLPGNPHAHELLLRQSAGNQHSPTVEATLADAYETRTANLIAYWNIMTDAIEERRDTPFQREMDAIHRDIRTRLGLNAELPEQAIQ